MERNVLDYEPHTALFVPDDNPLLFYRAIALFARSALKPGGQLYFEINPLFTSELSLLLSETGFIDVEISLDYTGRKRFASAKQSPDIP